MLKVRDAAACFIVLVSLTGTAMAAPDVEPTLSAEAWWERQDVQVGAGIGFGLLVVGLAIRGHRRARRRAIELANRRTQFGMSAVNPMIAQRNLAAWERSPAVIPTAMRQDMLNADARRTPPAPQVPHTPQPNFAAPAHAPSFAAQHAPTIATPAHAPSIATQPAPSFAAPHTPSFAVPQQVPSPMEPRAAPYHGYSPADLAAFGMAPPAMSPSPSPVHPPMVASYPPPMVASRSAPTVMPFAMVPPPASPLVPAVAPKPALRRCHAPWAAPVKGVAHPQQPTSFAPPQPMAFAPQQPMAFAPSQPKAMQQPSTPHVASPADQCARTWHPFAQMTSAEPEVALMQPASFAPQAVSARRARLADGTPQPPITDPQPFAGLPPSYLPPSQFVMTDPEATTHFEAGELPRSFVLEMSMTEMTAIVEPGQLARGSQPREQLERSRRTLPQVSPPDARTQIAVHDQRPLRVR